jgi:hypothetical protein
MPKNVILVPSKLMDDNQKPDRDENSLVRMAKVAREVLDEEGIALAGKKAMELKTFMAFSKDIERARGLVEEERLKEDDLKKVCFVSSANFTKLGGNGDFFKCKLATEEVLSELLIGTDPELLFMDKGKIVHANQVNGFGNQYKFGFDGAMAELRPDPANTPEGLVANIRSVLNDDAIINPVSKYDWVSACYYETNVRDYPVGTHIHIDNPKKIADLEQGRRYRLFAVTNKILDELLTLPMIRLDGNDGHKRRARCKMSAANGYNRDRYGKGYGFFGEWRAANGRLEYRSLSGLPLMDPDICTMVFGVAKAIAEAVYSEALKNNLDPNFILPDDFSKKGIYSNNFTSWEDVPLAVSLECTAHSKEVADLMNESSRSKVSPRFIKGWLQRVRKLSTYNKYEDYIEGLGDLLSCSAAVLEGFNKNMNNTWKE